MLLRPALITLGLVLPLAVNLTRAQSETTPDCGASGALHGMAVSSPTLPLPSDGAQVWAVVGFHTTPQALPLWRTGSKSGVLIVPMTRTLDLPEAAPLVLVGLDRAIDDEAAQLVRICAGLAMRIYPPPPDPGGDLPFATRAEALAARYDTALAVPPIGGFQPLVTAADELRVAG